MNLNNFNDTSVHHDNIEIIKIGIIGLATHDLHLCIAKENHSEKIEEILWLCNAIEDFM
ncbi:MAG: hypothetical protein ACRC9L_03055 [Brevinema sp.]